MKWPNAFEVLSWLCGTRFAIKILGDERFSIWSQIFKDPDNNPWLEKIANENGVPVLLCHQLQPFAFLFVANKGKSFPETRDEFLTSINKLSYNNHIVQIGSSAINIDEICHPGRPIFDNRVQPGDYFTVLFPKRVNCKTAPKSIVATLKRDWISLKIPGYNNEITIYSERSY